MRSPDFDWIDDEINPDGILPRMTEFPALDQELVRVIRLDDPDRFLPFLVEFGNRELRHEESNSVPEAIIICAWQREALEIICALPAKWAPDSQVSQQICSTCSRVIVRLTHLTAELGYQLVY